MFISYFEPLTLLWTSLILVHKSNIIMDRCNQLCLSSGPADHPSILHGRSLTLDVICKLLTKSFIHCIQICTISHVLLSGWLASQLLFSWPAILCGWNSSIGHCMQSFQHYSCHAYRHHFIPLSVALILAGSLKVSAVQNLVALFSHTFFNSIGWNLALWWTNSGWTSWFNNSWVRLLFYWLR